MRVAIFFLWLCFFLVKGGEYSQAVQPSHGCGYTHLQQVYPAHQKQSFATSHDEAVFNTVNAHHSTGDFIIAGDVEDDDLNNSLVRKFKWLDNCYSSRLYQSSADHSIEQARSASSFYGSISPKYILQRVLRV